MANSRAGYLTALALLALTVDAHAAKRSHSAVRVVAKLCMCAMAAKTQTVMSRDEE